MRPSSSQVSFIAMCSVLGLVMGCKGCDDPADTPAASAEPEPEGPSQEQLKERLAGLNLDRTKTYPKRADGVADCGDDKTCFLVMAERCEPALLDHESREPAGLLVKSVHARYRIEGPRDGSCAVKRLVIEADAMLPDEARKALEGKGRGEMEIDLMLTEAKLLLQSTMPPRSTCLFSMPRALELGLDMVENKPFDRHFQESCEVVGAEDDWPADLTPPPAAN